MWYAHIKVSPVARWAISKVDKVLTPSKESFAFPSDKVISTGHGINVELFSPDKTAQKRTVPTILAQSRISRVKRVHILLNTLTILKRNHPNLKFRCRIIGGTIYPDDEKYLNELKSQARKNNVNENLEWIGWVPNLEMPKFYNEASVFVRLQGGGGFGKTELEAMACGTPIVVPTPVYNKSLKEFSEYIYFPEDNAEKCAQNIAQILKWDESRRKEYAKQARNLVVENHNIKNVAKRLADEFSRLI